MRAPRRHLEFSDVAIRSSFKFLGILAILAFPYVIAVLDECMQAVPVVRIPHLILLALNYGSLLLVSVLMDWDRVFCSISDYLVISLFQVLTAMAQAAVGCFLVAHTHARGSWRFVGFAALAQLAAWGLFIFGDCHKYTGDCPEREWHREKKTLVLYGSAEAFQVVWVVISFADLVVIVGTYFVFFTDPNLPPECVCNE